MIGDAAAVDTVGLRSTSPTFPAARTVEPFAVVNEAKAKATPSKNKNRWCLLTRAVVLLAILVSGCCWFLYLGLPVPWWAVPATLLPPFLLPLLTVAPLGALSVVHLWRRVPVSAVAAVAVLTLLSIYPAFSRSGIGLASGPAEQPAAQSIRVLTWNTEYWDQDEAPGALYARLADFDADVYLLQEYLHWSKGPVEIKRMSQLREQFPGMTIEQHGELVTISRYPVTATSVPGNADPTHTGWPASYIYDKTLRTDVRVGSKVLSLYNVHITVPVDLGLTPWKASFFQTVQERQSHRVSEFNVLRRDLASNPNPVLVGGDFNTSPAMADLQNSLGENLQDGADASEDIYPVTWPADGPALWRLDWALHSDAVRVSSFETPQALGLSDHLPQLLEVELKGSPR